jgi:phage gp29-like protein
MTQAQAALAIPHGSETLTVELTVKEAMALGHNVHFAVDKEIEASAKRKIARTLEKKLLPGDSKIDYYSLQL